jgi:hypothetical protein
MPWTLVDDTEIVIAQLEAQLRALVHDTAKAALEDARAAAPIDTGALRASGCIVDEDGAGIAAAQAAALAANPHVKLDDAPLGEIEAAQLAGLESATFAFLAYYAEFLELGYSHASGRHMAPRPFLAPALAAHQAAMMERAALILAEFGVAVA